jgi:hypothetical protein
MGDEKGWVVKKAPCSIKPSTSRPPAADDKQPHRRNDGQADGAERRGPPGPRCETQRPVSTTGDRIPWPASLKLASGAPPSDVATPMVGDGVCGSGTAVWSFRRRTSRPRTAVRRSRRCSPRSMRLPVAELTARCDFAAIGGVLARPADGPAFWVVVQPERAAEVVALLSFFSPNAELTAGVGF